VSLARTVAPAKTDGGVVRHVLDTVLKDASAAATAAGCRAYDDPGDQRDCTSGLTLILLDAELKPGPDWHFMDLAERTEAYDRFLARMADRVAELSARGEVYIEVNAGPYAVPRNRPALIEFELGLVEPARLPVGYVLAVLPVPKDAGRNEAAAACRELIAKARTEARWGDRTGTGEYRGVVHPEMIREPSYEEVEATVAEIARLQGEMHLDARLAAVIVPPTGAETANYSNIDVPNYRIDVDPVL
jgi:hypothetical protein